MKIFTILILLIMTSCALPAPEFERQEFIPKREVVVNSLYKEGVALYQSGRFLDAELKLRQAVYLYPEAETLKANLALILKSSALYDESNLIYTDLIKRYPQAYDYKFALAESFYRQKKFRQAEELFKEVVTDFDNSGESAKAADTARSLASMYFTEGDEISAYCSSVESLNYSPVDAQKLRHIRILLAVGYYQKAHDELLPIIQNPSDIKDLNVLKLASLVFYGINDVEQSKKFMNLAKENQTAGIKEFDAELEKIRELILYKYPDPPDPEELEGEESPEEGEKPQLIFSEQNLLYWPAGLVRLYYEYQQKVLEESEKEKRGLFF